MKNKIDYYHNALKTELNLTQVYVKSFSETTDKLANKAIKHIVANKGKMLRPMFLILAGRYTYQISADDKKNEEVFLNGISKAAAILELLQISSLIHDDVLDHSMSRRNKPTLNSFKGNRFAILIGDYLVAQSLKNCYQLVHDVEKIFDSEIMFAYLDGISKLVLGEVQQNNFNENTHKSGNEIERYFEIIENKTASLFSLACFVGSKIGNKSTEFSELFQQFGFHVGMAYQMIDDLRDFAFTKDVAGESNFQDIKFGIKTLPLIYAEKFAQNGEHEKLQNCFNSRKNLTVKEKLEILDILEKTGSIDKCLSEIKLHIEKAKTVLSQLQVNEYSILLTDFVGFLSSSCDTVVDDIRGIKTI